MTTVPTKDLRDLGAGTSLLPPRPDDDLSQLTPSRPVDRLSTRPVPVAHWVLMPAAAGRGQLTMVWEVTRPLTG